MIETTSAERRLSRWQADADSLEQRAAQVLATAVAVAESMLATTLRDVFSVRDPSVLNAAMTDLLQRPFVERVAEGYRVSEPLAALLRTQFRDEDPESFAAVNRRLLDAERTHFELVEDESERWFVRGRISFYLAAIDPEESAESFIETFARPPAGDPGPPRSWLAQLAIRQRDSLQSEPRSLHFFQGFRDYKAGDFASARQHFEEVLVTSERDSLRAIALHLWSVLSDRSPLSEGNLRESVSLSQELGLTENEVMARNTLVFKLVAKGSRSQRSNSPSLREAARLAQTNLQQAENLGDDYLRIWCLSAQAQAVWLSVSDNRQNPGAVDPVLVASLGSNLRTAVAQASAMSDLESAAVAVNASASMYRDRGEYSRAVDEIVDAFDAWRRLEAPTAARRWLKTLGSLRSANVDPQTKARASRVIGDVDRWLNRKPAGRVRRSARP